MGQPLSTGGALDDYGNDVQSELDARLALRDQTIKAPDNGCEHQFGTLKYGIRFCDDCGEATDDYIS